jgi:Zn-finger nucleic acid-binding protein
MINCPKCSSEKLVETLTLGNIPLDVCPGCSGIWFDKGELEALLKQSQGWHAADFTLLNPKAEGLVCPRCKNTMTRGGMVNPLLLVDKCQSCDGIWLDSHELDLVRKLLGLSGGPSEVKVDRPAAVPAAPLALDAKFSPVTVLYWACAILGLVGLSCEMYLYFSPAAAVSHAPSAGVSVASVLFFAGGIFGLNREK